MADPVSSSLVPSGDLFAALLSVNREVGRVLEDLQFEELDINRLLAARAQLGVLRAEFDELSNQLTSAFGAGSARARIFEYFKLRVGEVVTKEELAGVAGIFDYQRRIRELRKIDGWDILSNEGNPKLRPGDYVLRSLDSRSGTR